MKRLYRSEKDRRLGGLCGGLGELFNVDPTLLRLATVFLCIITGVIPVVFTYIVGCIIIPQGPLTQ